MLLQEIFEQIDSRKSEMVEHRRHIHKNAELSFEEKQTAEYIKDYYKDKDVQITTDMGDYGLKALIDTGKAGKTIALRADFDALPLV